MELRSIFLQNAHVLLDRKTTRAILCDYFNNDMIKVNTMLTAYDEGIVDSLRSKLPMSAPDKTRFVKVLVQHHAMVDEKAVWAVDTWNRAISQDVVIQLDRIETEEVVEDEIDEEIDLMNLNSEAIEDEFFEVETRNELEEYYINPHLSLRNDRTYIPCGVGNSDNGFFVYGIKKESVCKNPSADIFALVYNYLIRNSRMDKEDIPKYIQEQEGVFELDYRSIFRIAIVLLLLIKNNYASKNTLNVAYYGKNTDLKYATRLINHYAALFCRLIGISPTVLTVNRKKDGIPIRIDGTSGIVIKDNNEFYSNARELWYGRRINYRIDKNKISSQNKADFEYILSEISPFDSFKEGQLESLISMLSSKNNMVCIMPTGSGKSLIYYFISLLQPLPLFIVSPTDILIQDQIRNLRQIHRIDNVSHLQLTDSNTFECFEMFNSLNYITPTTLQNAKLLIAFRYFNRGIIQRYGGDLKRENKISANPLLSCVVLDEIHCISNWGHDFRPEYLMLSKFLNKYLDQITILGFTATANYTVVEDVQNQLRIPQENFISPIGFGKYNISYDFICLESTDLMYKKVAEITQKHINRNERTIIFTKNDEISEQVAKAVGYEADVFSRDNPKSYHLFAEEKCRVLVASDELGVGINFPNIRNIIHFGLPLSKSGYVQEVGRAGRANEFVHSYVLYLSSENAPSALLRRDASFENVAPLLEGIDNDYSDTYKKLTNNCPTSETLYKQLRDLVNDFKSRGKKFYVEPCAYSDLDSYRRRIYMLYVVGYIYDWYSYSKSKNVDGIDIFIDITSTKAASSGSDPKALLLRMKDRTVRYFQNMDNSRENIAETNRATNPKSIIKTYVDWFFHKFLYHHNEQFLDLYDFITSSHNVDDDTVTDSIKDYFTLPFIRLKSDEESFNSMDIKGILQKALSGTSKSTVTNIERINSNRYSYKLDYFLFATKLKSESVFETDRLDRICRTLTNEEKQIIGKGFTKLYCQCKSKGRLEILRYLSSSENTFPISYVDLMNEVYKDEPRDLIFYGFVAERVNRVFHRVGGKNV